MDIEKYNLDELLLVGIKSEIESEKVYRSLAGQVKDPFLRNRLEFLASEEKGHRAFLEGLFRKKFPEKPLVVPEKSRIPLPEVHMYGETGSIRDVISVMDEAMKAEEAAADFYNSLKARCTDQSAREILHYLALMEMDHYKILKMEREEIAKVEEVMEDTSFMRLDGMY